MPIQLSGSLVITGSITTTGVITMSGSIASASYSSTSDLLQGTGSIGFATTASLLAVSSSQQQISASYIALSASYNTFSGSASTRITANSSSIQQVSSSQQQISASLLNVISIFATTGSNSFRANQSITGSLVVSSTITAQTLIVQTVTSSIVYSSGSNVFGCDLNSRQTFTGSVNITGSTTLNGALTGTSTTFSSDGNTLTLSRATPSLGGLIVFKDQVGTSKARIGIENNANDFIIQDGSNNTRLTILNSTGVATFACSVTAGGTITLNAAAANYATLNLNGAAGYGAELKFGEVTGGYLAAIRHNYNIGTGLEFYTGGLGAGNLRMYIAPSGNVGIGTSTTTCRRLTIFGESTCVRGIAFRGCAAGDGGNIFLEGYDTDDNEYSNFEFVANSGNGYFAFNSGAGSNCNNWTQNARMVIGTNGKVGIGVTNPTGSLDVSGSIYIKSSGGGVLFIPRLTDPNHGLSIGEQNTIGSKSAVIRTGGGVSEYLFIDPGLNDSNAAGNIALASSTTGSVGIGTYLPLSKFHQVINDGATYAGDARFGGSSTQFGIELKYNQASTTSGSIYVSPGYSSVGVLFKLGAGSGNTNQLVLKGDGNVGIGTCNPGEKFTVQGPANNWTGNFIGSSTTGQSLGLLVTAGSNSTDWPFYTQTANSATTLLRVRGDGLIYTGLASLSPYNYGVSGGVALYVGSAGQIGYNSSIRESKANIKDITNVNWLNSLKPVTFNKKKKDDEGNYIEELESELQYGLIAEDVEEVNSNFIFYNSDGKLAGVHYDRLIAPMLKAIQEQQCTINLLKSCIGIA